MAHRNMEIIRGSSNKNWQSNQQKNSMTSSSSSKITTPTFNPLCIIDPSTGRRYKRFEDMYTMTPLRGLVKQGSNNNNNHNNNNDVSNLDSPQTSLGGNINISETSLNLGQIGSSSYDPQERSTFRSYPPPSQYVEPGLSVGGSGHQGVNNANIDVNLVWDPNKSSNNFQIGAFSQTPFFETQTNFPSMQYVESTRLPGSGSQQGVNYSNMDVNQFWDINQYSNNSQNTLGAHSPIFETQTNVPTVVKPVPQNGGHHLAHLNQETIIMSEAEVNRSILFEIAEKLGVNLDSPSPNNQQDDVDLMYSTNAPSSPTSELIRVIPQFPMEASFQPSTTLVPQSTQQEYGVVSAGISVPSLPDFPSFFSHQGSGNFTSGVSIPALPDFPQTFTHQGNNNGGMTIRALETILEAEDNMGRNNMNASVQWTPPVGKGIVNRAYDTAFVELGQPVDPYLRFFMNMQGNSSNPIRDDEGLRSNISIDNGCW